MKALTIGQAARSAGIGVETVRFYERQGLLPEPPRLGSGYRQYPEDVVDRLRFIRQAKELGFSLKEIKELLALRVDPNTTCAQGPRSGRGEDHRHRSQDRGASEDQASHHEADEDMQRPWPDQ